MEGAFDLSKMLAGIALFMLGMHFLEGALRQLSGRGFKLFLKKQTSNRVKAIAGGAVVTGILQSSSVVNLVVLGFVGSGIIHLSGALALMLGANLGTTFDTWVVAALGFKINIEAYAMPVLGIAGISMLLSGSGSRLQQWCTFLFGISLLFTGLDYMKNSIVTVAQTFNIGQLNQYPVIVFLIAGILITTIIQSSSATVAIVLSALHADLVTYQAATAIVLGAEAGTTVKLLLASVGGSPIKKRVATGNLLINLVTVVIVFTFLGPFNRLIVHVIGMGNKLMALALFQTMTNLVSVVLFFPLLNILSEWLNRRFREGEHLTFYLHKVPVAEADLATQAMTREATRFVNHIIFYCYSMFGQGYNRPDTATKKFADKTPGEQYDDIKHLHGDIYEYYIAMQRSQVDEAVARRSEAVVAAVRNGMYAAKSIRDITQDIDQLRNSSNEVKYNTYLESRQKTLDFCEQVTLVLNKEEPIAVDELVALYKNIHSQYDLSLKRLYKEATLSHLSEIEVSTIVNFNRELYTFYKSMVFAVRHLLLPKGGEAAFDELPGFIN